MTTSSTEWAPMAVWAGFAGAMLALAVLALAPAGWRLGLWHFRTSFYWLMPASAFLAAGAALLSLAGLTLGASTLGGFDAARAVTAIIVGAALVYVPWQYKRTLAHLPVIHDISTDTTSPPAFVAVMDARKAESANRADYEGHEIARQQQSAYPDVVPLDTRLATADAFKQALAVAEAMPGWHIVARDMTTGRIEASQTSRWFGFTDDIVIRIAPGPLGSRIDMRSLSRQGRSDFGVNAARIRAFMAELKGRLG